MYARSNNTLGTVRKGTTRVFLEIRTHTYLVYQVDRVDANPERVLAEHLNRAADAPATARDGVILSTPEFQNDSCSLPWWKRPRPHARVSTRLVVYDAWGASTMIPAATNATTTLISQIPQHQHYHVPQHQHTEYRTKTSSLTSPSPRPGRSSPPRSISVALPFVGSMAKSC